MSEGKRKVDVGQLNSVGAVVTEMGKIYRETRRDENCTRATTKAKPIIRMKTMDNLIATIPKNIRDRIEVSLSEFTKDGVRYDMVSAWAHYDDGTCQYRPGRNGINVQVKLLPALIEALLQAEKKARAAGLIQGYDFEDYCGNTILGAG